MDGWERGEGGWKEPWGFLIVRYALDAVQRKYFIHTHTGFRSLDPFLRSREGCGGERKTLFQRRSYIYIFCVDFCVDFYEQGGK